MGDTFAGRVALITGAARGFGRATAEYFLAREALVAVHVRTAERAQSLADELGDGARAVWGDLTDPTAASMIVEQCLDHFQRLDILVNNAAAAYTTRFEQITEDEWREALEVNLTAPFLLTRAALPQMKSQQFGRIINVSSLAGRTVSTLGGAHYTASKTGLLGLTRAAAKELGKYGVTVNAVCPGLFDTELTQESATKEQLDAAQAGFPVARLGRPEELAALIGFLASEEAGYISGAALDINGGSLMI